MLEVINITKGYKMDYDSWKLESPEDEHDRLYDRSEDVDDMEDGISDYEDSLRD